MKFSLVLFSIVSIVITHCDACYRPVQQEMQVQSLLRLALKKVVEDDVLGSKAHILQLCPSDILVKILASMNSDKLGVDDQTQQRLVRWFSNKTKSFSKEQLAWIAAQICLKIEVPEPKMRFFSHFIKALVRYGCLEQGLLRFKMVCWFLNNKESFLNKEPFTPEYKIALILSLALYEGKQERVNAIINECVQLIVSLVDDAYCPKIPEGKNIEAALELVAYFATTKEQKQK